MQKVKVAMGIEIGSKVQMQVAMKVSTEMETKACEYVDMLQIWNNINHCSNGLTGTEFHPI